MAQPASNEMGPIERETNFRRGVRQAVDMHPMDRDERIVLEVQRLKKFEQDMIAAGRTQLTASGQARKVRA